MHNKLKKNKNTGFTLIELLVVIAIISLMSSIVFASLNSARNKSKDAAIKTSVNQLRLIMEQHYNDYGSYTQLQPYIWYPSNACGTSISGTYAAQVTAICNNMISNNVAGKPTVLWLGNSISNSSSYSIEGYLPSKGTYYCIGSSGATSDTDLGGGTAPGCALAP